jgi:hypothetical protein
MLGNGLLCLWRSRRSRGGCRVGDIEWNAQKFCSQKDKQEINGYAPPNKGRDLYSCHRLLWKWFPFFLSSVTGTVLLSNVEGSRQQDWIHITVGVATPSWIWILHNVCILSTRTISLVGCCGTGNYHSKAQCRTRFQTNEFVLGNLPHDAQFLDTGLLQQPLDILRRLLWNDKTTITFICQAVSMELPATTNGIFLRAHVCHVTCVC